MRRQDDISELLEATANNIFLLRKSYETALHDEEQLHAARPVVKTILGDLRSILDYAAMSIYETYSKKSSNKVQFPWGDNEKYFLGAITKYLNGIDLQRPDIFALVRSIQPFECNDSWLSDLCTAANTTKHRNLGAQQRVNSQGGAISVGSAFMASSGGKIVMTDCIIDGVSVGDGKEFVLTDSLTTKEVQEYFGDSVKVSKSYDWVRFELDDFGDALEIVEKAQLNVRDFLQRLSQLVEI